MALTDYPTALDTFSTKKNNTDLYDAKHYNKIQEALVALETKLGIDSSADTSSFDYKVRNNYAFSGGVALPAVYNSANINNAASGDNTIYTCPANTRAAIKAVTLRNTAGTTTTYYFKYTKSGGSTYKIYSSTTINTNISAVLTDVGIILNPGDVLIINTSQTGLNVFTAILEFPSSFPIQSQIIVGHSSGNNTVYTCPSGKRANLISTSGMSFGIPEVTPRHAVLLEEIGSGTYTWYHVPNGGSAQASNVFGSGSSTSGTRATTGHSGGILTAGESIVLNTDQAGAASIAWVNTYEFSV